MTKAERIQLVYECRASGKSMRTWCRENGIPYTTFLGWSRRMAAEVDEVTTQDTLSQIAPKEPETGPNQSVMWAKVKAIPYDSEPTMASKTVKPVNGEQIRLSCNNWTVSVGDGFNTDMLTKVLRAVNDVCC